MDIKHTWSATEVKEQQKKIVINQSFCANKELLGD